MTKAKDIASKILAASEADMYDVTSDAACDLAITSVSEASKRSNTSSMLACLRESFSKWKSVVSQVKSAHPEAEISESFFPKAVSVVSAPLFALALSQRVFLGYTPDEFDKDVAATGERQVRDEQERKRYASLAKEARRMGLNEETFLIEARRMGYKV